MAIANLFKKKSTFWDERPGSKQDIKETLANSPVFDPPEGRPTKRLRNSPVADPITRAAKNVTDSVRELDPVSERQTEADLKTFSRLRSKAAKRMRKR